MNPAKIASDSIQIQLTKWEMEEDEVEIVDLIKVAYAPFVQTVRDFVKVVNALEVEPSSNSSKALDVFERLEEFLKEMENVAP